MAFKLPYIGRSIYFPCVGLFLGVSGDFGSAADGLRGLSFIRTWWGEVDCKAIPFFSQPANDASAREETGVRCAAARDWRKGRYLEESSFLFPPFSPVLYGEML